MLILLSVYLENAIRINEGQSLSYHTLSRFFSIGSTALVGPGRLSVSWSIHSW
jgi:hypothetical protein